MIYDLAITDRLYFYQKTDVVTSVLSPCYGNLVEGGSYFNRRLRTQAWDEATAEERQKALYEATLIIDRLNFIGKKTYTGQYLQFPRYNDLVVPVDIRLATYEIALALLDGVDPDLEIENLSSTSQGYAGTRDTYDRNFVLDHIRAGVPSAKAFAYLKPYLVDPTILKLSRVE